VPLSRREREPFGCVTVINEKITNRVGDRMAKTASLTMAIVFTVLLAGLVMAQPSASEPTPEEVPEVAQPEVANPVLPAEPSTAGEEPAVGVGALGNHCACPPTHCANGEVPPCETYCSEGEEPVCACDGVCDSDGNAKAMNRCACQ
jgi:hypothetical protein